MLRTNPFSSEKTGLCGGVSHGGHGLLETWQRLLTVGLLVAAVGCGGHAPPPKKSANPPPIPRITPSATRAEVAVEPEPEKAEPPPAPKEKIPVGPWLEFSVAGGDKIECQGYLKLHSIGVTDGVLELANYDAAHHEEFPSLYIRALVPAKSIAELINKKLPASLFIQVDETGHVLHNEPPQAVELAITEMDGKNVRGTFTGQVRDLTLGGNGSIVGKFQAVIE